MKKKNYSQFRSYVVTICWVVLLLAPCSSLYAQKPDPIASDFENMIKGREAGVAVSASDHSPATAFNIIIRGLKSFRGSNEPLIVLDGAVMNPQSIDTYRALIEDDRDYQAVLNSLSMINPLDIESVEFLKDAHSTSKYGGLEGANGVVVITTKRGYADRERPEVRWQSEVDFSTLYKGKDMLGKAEYLDYLSTVAPSSQILTQDDLKEMDWQKEATRTAVSHKHYVSVAGSGENSRYFLSGNFADDKGIMNRSEAQTAAMRINYEFNLGKNATLSTTNILTYSNINLVQSVAPTGTMTATKSMVLSKPLLLSNNLADRNGLNMDLVGENYHSWQNDYDDATEQYRLVSNLNLGIGLFPFLKWKTNVGIDYRDDNRRRWIGNTIEKGFEKNSQVGNTAMAGFRYTADSYFAFDYTLNRKHNFAANAGVSLYGNRFKNNVTQSYDFVFPDLRGLVPGQRFPDAFGNATTTPTFNVYGISTFGYAGVMNMQYVFDDEIRVAAGLRADALSRYTAPAKNMDYYPSASVQWSLHNAEWLWGGESPLPFLNLHASWGHSGTQNVSPYRTLPDYVPENVPYPRPSDMVSVLGYNVMWKMINNQFDIGFDAKLLDERIALSVNFYDSYATDELGLYSAGLTGDAALIDGSLSNGMVHNRGVEVDLSAVIIDREDLKWSVGFNLTNNRNRIVDTGFGFNYTGTSVGKDPAGNNLFANTISADESVGTFYGFKTAGVVHERNLPYVPAFYGVKPSPGDVMFLDRDDDMNITNADRTIIGNPNPKVFGGLYTNLTYKNWSFGMMLDYRLGFDVMNLNPLDETWFASGNTNNITTEAFRNAYSASNLAGSYPGLDGVGQYMITDRLVEDGSFLRIADVSVGYNIPIHSVKWISKAFIRASVSNPFIFTKYSGYDPEVNGYAYQYMRYGLDSGSYPSSRSYIITIGANF